MTNKYAGTCEGCGRRVARGAGRCAKVAGRWAVRCEPCAADAADAQSLARFGESDYTHAEAREISRGDATSWAFVTSSGYVGYRNRAGRCEDAPCCGCCTF